MTILMTIPVMNQRHYWLLYGLGVALVADRPSSTSDPMSPSGKVERRDGP
jgi:hypothetical protein